MKVSGVTVVRNAIKYDYPVIEAIQAILPVCDEFVVNVGYSDDGTLDLIKTIDSPKIRITQTEWDMSQGPYVLAHQTNLAMAECRGDWIFYAQADELFHERDLPFLKRMMTKHLNDTTVDALRFKWLHFYGSFYRYRIDYGWFQKQERIVRNNGNIESYGDAYAFRRKDGKPLRYKHTHRLLYHYGWVHSADMMNLRRINHQQMGFDLKEKQNTHNDYSYGNLERFPVYFGTHPVVMQGRIEAHDISRRDWNAISRKYWWHPAKMFRIRYKTGKRVRFRIE